ncbi:TetR/AcrR family transcriptional regulator [Paenibacillus paeoniae]|uniref:TetR/AcrR family transcriptional regulator n=1 Tax=Paenibacillus paeoniae TaxID=2292705 RepID=A0A371PKN4_9BACL|nr:TetR/AcrR family transcriptional regulator [Paenibacillus paeoniae]REK76761.1 TetR/AcrR family transcriptional regulator [Paenibacillus paeoniae]
MGQSRSAAKEAKLHAILDAATELLVDKPTASLNEIAEHAGIGIATLHRYVESRDQLMLQLCLRVTKVVGETIKRIAEETEDEEAYIPALVEALVPMGDKIHYLTHEASLYYSDEMAAAENEILEPIRSSIRALQEKGIMRRDMDSEWILNVLYSLLILTWQQVQQGNIAKNFAAKLVLDTLYHGVRT